MSEKERAFADSNVLFSGSLGSVLFEPMWSIPEVEILTSQYSVDEVSANLKRVEHRSRLWRLVSLSTMVAAELVRDLPTDILVPAKDAPILQAAIAGRADVLITGDIHHFRALYGRTIAGCRIELPADFRDRFPAYFPVKSPK